MTWLDRIENTVFTITTGDGKIYSPLWKTGETSKEFNATVFDFIDQPKSYVDRRQVKSSKFPLLFWFQGADNIDQAAAFDKSANDSRVWTVNHPFYGVITGQPISILRNDANLNITEFNVDFWESISDKFPKSSIAVSDVISSRTVEFSTISPINYTSKVDLKPADVAKVKSSAERISAKIAAALDSSNYSEYQLVKNDMFSKVDKMISLPGPAIKSINDIILLPSRFGTSLSVRINMLKGIYSTVKEMLPRATSNDKAYFESQGGAVIMALSQTLVNPLSGDYVTRKDIEESSVALMSIYNDYVDTLDNEYVIISDANNSFGASSETQEVIFNTVIDTVSNLSSIAFSAKQERVVILDRDSNVILLTHKYMGLDADDENIDLFRRINNIKNKDLFLIKKGRQIRYYI